jgi:RNase P subunit RPR2
MATTAGMPGKQRKGKGQIGQETRAGSIRCSRCAGLMVIEQSSDSLLGTSEADVVLRRCVQCGEIIDPVILQNRRSQFGHDLSRTPR